MTMATAPEIAGLTCDEARRKAADNGLNFDQPDQDWSVSGRTLDNVLQAWHDYPFAIHISQCPECNQISESQYSQMVQAYIWVARYTEDEYQLNGSVQYYEEEITRLEAEIAKFSEDDPQRGNFEPILDHNRQSLNHFRAKAGKRRESKENAEQVWVALFD